MSYPPYRLRVEGGYPVLRLVNAPALEDEGAVGAAEAEAVREGVVDFGRLRLVGDVVQAALGIDVLEVHGRRRDLLLHRDDGDGCFQAACATEEVASHGLGGADRKRVIQRALTEDVLDGLGLECVAE